MIICITGGTGFIGSHICITLIEAGYTVICIDNLSNSSINVLDHIQKITGKKPEFYNLDLRDYDSLQSFFLQYRDAIHSVIHCAALKSVADSNKFPLDYYENNVTGTINLLKAMKVANCYNIIFSSSCTVYGEPAQVPLTEESRTQPINPYGRTKLYVESLLQDLAISDPQWTIISLRYFNPVGAHPSGLIGENPKGIPANLVPYILQVATGKQPYLTVYGNDYATSDGTCIRDYIHIMDLASAHMAAVLQTESVQGMTVINIGTGQGYTVMQIIAAMQRAMNKQISYIIGERRTGDAAICFASPKKAHDLLKWKTHYTLDDMCRDAWHYINTYSVADNMVSLANSSESAI